MKIWIGCDHAGYERKLEILAWLKSQQIEGRDCGCNGEKADYPKIAKIVAKNVAANPGDFGILICGTGIGMSIAANKCKGIRAALCAEPFSAKFSRIHNDANVLCVGARTLGREITLDIVDVFLHNSFLGEHHTKRVQMIEDMEK